VYSFVRHPLYFGCLLMMIGAPLLVGSVAGLLLTALGTVGLASCIAGALSSLGQQGGVFERQALMFARTMTSNHRANSQPSPHRQLPPALG
jgi:hypothetical protein